MPRSGVFLIMMFEDQLKTFRDTHRSVTYMIAQWGKLEPWQKFSATYKLADFGEYLFGRLEWLEEVLNRSPNVFMHSFPHGNFPK